MKKIYSNIKMAEMLCGLKPLLTRRDKFGYIAARNYRRLSESLTEYTAFKSGLIEKYGEPDLDENGKEVGTISLNINSPAFPDFIKELEPFGRMEHEVELMTAKYEDAVNSLSGEEILNIDWMLED